MRLLRDRIDTAWARREEADDRLGDSTQDLPRFAT
jgi:hypothetical protein